MDCFPGSNNKINTYIILLNNNLYLLGLLTYVLYAVYLLLPHAGLCNAAVISTILSNKMQNEAPVQVNTTLNLVAKALKISTIDVAG
jgi:hypothetical protein